MKYKLIVIIRSLLKVLYIFPIKKNRIMFTAYNGKQYSCNPKYIYEYFIGEDSNNEIEYIWAFEDPSAFKLNENTKKVKYKSLSYIFYTLTSQVVIENTESWSIIPIRKGQLVVNTWHGGGSYKRVGLHRKDASNFNDLNVKFKNERINLYISSSEYFSEYTLRESFDYKGRILQSGMPRNDILVENNPVTKEEIKAQLGITSKKTLIIAPTFRTKDKHDFLSIDFDMIVDSLEKNFGGDWIILYRSHYYEDIDSNTFSTDIIDVSGYPDMQELLLVSDVLITDYSSSMWDFSLMKKPVFLYATDLHEYQNKERDFYKPIEEWPFSFSNSMEELISNIKNYEASQYELLVSGHHDDLNSYEKGVASNNTYEYIQKYINRLRKKEKVND